MLREVHGREKAVFPAKEKIRASESLSEDEKAELLTSMGSDKFCDALMSMKFTSNEDYAYMYGLLFRKNTPRDTLLSVVYELISSVKKRPEDWLRFLVYSSKAHRDEAIEAVLDVIYEMPKPEKVLSQLDKATPRKNRAESDMFADIEELAEKDLEGRPKKGILGRLAGFFMRRWDGEQKS